MSLLEQLAAPDAWGMVLTIAVFGALGGLIHRLTNDEPSAPAWNSVLVGMVAAIGFASVKTPTTPIELVGLSALAGFFARGVLAALESRIDLVLARQQADRALALAGDAIELSRRQRAAGSPGALDVDVSRLSARFDEVKSSRTARPS